MQELQQILILVEITLICLESLELKGMESSGLFDLAFVAAHFALGLLLSPLQANWKPSALIFVKTKAQFIAKCFGC